MEGAFLLSPMKVYDRVSLDQWFLAAMGSVFLVLSGIGVVHGTKAALAARLSCRAQSSYPSVPVDQILSLCQRAYSLYPWNYYFSIFSAEAAYYQSDAVYGEARTERLRLARLWCDRGLIQNPYKSQLRRLKTRFLWEDSPAQAIAYWASHTEWQFWDPYNHATLSELYARNGDISKAEQELKWIVGDALYEPTCKTVMDEKKSWDAILSGKPEDWGE